MGKRPGPTKRASQKAGSRKKAAKKTPAKKTASKKSAAKKAAPKKSPSRKGATKKSTARKLTPKAAPFRPPYRCQTTPEDGVCLRFNWNEAEQAYNLPTGGIRVSCLECEYFL
jgi:hypothetical protein